MYLEHFGLERLPFVNAPDTSIFFKEAQRGDLLEAAINAIRSGEAVIKVVGDVGSGKTLLCRMLGRRLHDEVAFIYLVNPTLAPEDVPAAVASELNLGPMQPDTRANTLRAIQEYLLTLRAQGRRVVALVEEAQSMSPESLEELRLLSNLESETNALFQMVLFGKPELDLILSETINRSLRDRIVSGFYLTPLTYREVTRYLIHRLNACGCSNSDLFTPAAIRAIAFSSGGLLRRINILAHKALMSAYVDGLNQARWIHVRNAVKNSEFGRYWQHWLRPVVLMLGGGMLFLAGGITAVRLGWFACPECALTPTPTAQHRMVAPSGGPSMRSTPPAIVAQSPQKMQSAATPVDNATQDPMSTQPTSTQQTETSTSRVPSETSILAAQQRADLAPEQTTDTAEKPMAPVLTSSRRIQPSLTNQVSTLSDLKSDSASPSTPSVGLQERPSQDPDSDTKAPEVEEESSFFKAPRALFGLVTSILESDDETQPNPTINTHTASRSPSEAMVDEANASPPDESPAPQAQKELDSRNASNPSAASNTLQSEMLVKLPDGVQAESYLYERMDASRKWLAESPPGQHTLQLILAPLEVAAERFKTLFQKKMNKPLRILVFPLTDGVAMVCAGDFSSFSLARKALIEMENNQRTSGVFIQTARNLQSQLRQIKRPVRHAARHDKKREKGIERRSGNNQP
ncbi:MAG: AAA family ATPase [Magnetococcales bacterium]|nr:AAA family ATPase [Magnetococcales bacterium]